MNDFSGKIILGRTGLHVSRMGIGSSYGVGEKGCRTAFEAGINYFFWGSVRTVGMGLALRHLAKYHRKDVVITLESYARKPEHLERSIEIGLKKLKIDYADILLLGWHDGIPDNSITDTVLNLKEKGLFHFLGISSHQRPLFQGFLKDGFYDVFHLRYNAAHRGAEKDIFPFLNKKTDPGIVSFTNTRWGDLLKAKNMPKGIQPMSASDCYRFSLSNPNVHVAISGPKNDKELESALCVLGSDPVSGNEMEKFRKIGDHVHGVTTLMSYLS